MSTTETKNRVDDYGVSKRDVYPNVKREDYKRTSGSNNTGSNTNDDYKRDAYKRTTSTSDYKRDIDLPRHSGGNNSNNTYDSRNSSISHRGDDQHGTSSNKDNRYSDHQSSGAPNFRAGRGDERDTRFV